MCSCVEVEGEVGGVAMVSHHSECGAKMAGAAGSLVVCICRMFMGHLHDAP